MLCNYTPIKLFLKITTTQEHSIQEKWNIHLLKYTQNISHVRSQKNNNKFKMTEASYQASIPTTWYETRNQLQEKKLENSQIHGD